MKRIARRPRASAVVIVAWVLLAVALAPLSTAAAERPTLTLLTHDSFLLPDATIAAFEDTYDVNLEVLRAGDAGAMVNQAILTADHPLADVLYGIDNTFLSRALKAGIFEPYQAAALADVNPELIVDPSHRVTPIDRADVCLNYDRSAFTDLAPPQRLADLLDPAYAGMLVVEDPSTSSPGLSFLLATIAAFGDDPDTGWQSFWRGLRANDVAITAGWEEAYYGSFSGGSGEGDRPIVVSYASSPAAEVVYGPDPSADEAPTAAIDAGCFEQIEFAGVLAGTAQPELARDLIDFLLAPATQAELPLSMFVDPVVEGVEVPAEFQQFALVPSDPLRMDPDVIDAGRDGWIREWTDIVLR